ncbi:Delta-sterol C-methyltransferase [Mycena indigotica]|uniref:Acyl-protein thioesterase 1 n=1 Tax=Mycena indigotica TaxID=2126181 RepID=A0A8H6TFM5_9AGAR|nr:Delta-sterol C-methyltransferase [Mycena indigotica]KAF7316476.1 Delta-sterol C-methyltransferase [Mycena indigotica]
MPAWFDLYTYDLPVTPPPAGEEDEEGIRQSIMALDTLLTDTIAESGVDPSRIVLGGISQGGAMSLLTGLTIPTKLGGLIALSSRLPLRYKFKSMTSSHASSIPIFWGHGTADRIVTLELGQASAQYLINEVGIPRSDPPGAPQGLSFLEYSNLEHRLRDDELLDVMAWLKKIIPAQ